MNAENFLEQLMGPDMGEEERTPEEVAYDKVMLKELGRGRTIERALRIAAKKFPDEALQYTKETLGDIAAHYEYIGNRNLIKKRLGQI